MADWPQLAHDAARTGYQAENLPGPAPSVLWRHAFQPARVHPQAQPLVVGANVLLATEGGNGQLPGAYGFTLTAGARPAGWSADFLQLPAGAHHSGASDGTRVVYGCDQGWVVAQTLATGAQAWAVQPGAARLDASERHSFHAAPLWTGSRFVIGGDDGYLYALNPSDGALAWPAPYNAGAPLHTAACADGTNAYVLDWRARLHAVKLSDGTPATGWATNPVQLDGAGGIAYFPVITGGLVIAVPWVALYEANCTLMPGAPFGGANIASQWTYVQAHGASIAAGTPDSSFFTPQDTLMTAYAASPSSYHPLYQVRNASNGTSALSFPHGFQAHNGPPNPPCVLDDGTIVVSEWVLMRGWGRVNLSTRRCIDYLYDGFDHNGVAVTSSTDRPAGAGNEDENYGVTACPNAIIAQAWTGQFVANYWGWWDRGGRRWHKFTDGKTDYRLFSNVNGGGAHGMVIASGNTGTVRTVCVEQHELVVRRWT